MYIHVPHTDYIEYSSGDDEPFADTLEDPSTSVSPCPSDDAEGFSRKSERKRDLQKQRSRSRSRSRVMSEVSKRGEVMKRQMSRQHSKQVGTFTQYAVTPCF